MNKQLKVAKKIEFMVNETYSVCPDGSVEQCFQFETVNKKYLPYAFDDRYVLKRKLDQLFKEDALRCGFERKVDHSDKVVFIFGPGHEPLDGRKPRIVNMSFYLPPYNGCRFCRKAVRDGDVIYCPEKDKKYDSAGVKSCKVFSSIEEVLT